MKKLLILLLVGTSFMLAGEELKPKRAVIYDCIIYPKYMTSLSADSREMLATVAGYTQCGEYVTLTLHKNLETKLEFSESDIRRALFFNVGPPVIKGSQGHWVKHQSVLSANLAQKEAELA